MGASILAFGVTVAYWPGILASAVAPRWALLAVGLPLISWLDPRALPRHMLWLPVLFLAYAALSVMWSSDPLEGAHEWIHFAIFGTAMLAGANLSSEKIDMVFRAIACGLVASLAIGAAQMAGYSPLANQGASPSGLFFNRDFLAEFAAIVFVWAVMSRELRAAVIASIPLIFCGSRVALSAAVVALLLVRPRRVLLVVPAAAAGLVAASVLWPGKLVSVNERLAMWWDAITNTTLFGHGLGSYAADHPVWEHAHSDLLQSGYELGIGGLLPAALMVAALARPAPAPLRAVVVCIAVEYAVAFPLHLPAPAFVAGIVLGYLLQRRGDVRVVRSLGGGDLVAAV